MGECLVTRLFLGTNLALVLAPATTNIFEGLN